MAPAGPIIDDAAATTRPLSLVGAAARLPDLWGSYLPRRSVSSRRRERMLRAAAIGAGATWTARFHESWADYLGDALDERSADPLLPTIMSAAARGALPSDDGVFIRAEGDERRLALAAVAAGILAGRAERARARLFDPRAVWDSLRNDAGRGLVVDAVALSASIPFVAPLVTATWVLDGLNRIAGPETTVLLVGSRDDLFADVVAASLPGLLASAPARLLVRVLPIDLVVGLVEGAYVATVRIGSGQVVVEPGIADDCLAVLDGGFVAMLSNAADAVVREALDPDRV